MRSPRNAPTSQTVHTESAITSISSKPSAWHKSNTPFEISEIRSIEYKYKMGINLESFFEDEVKGRYPICE